jgi:uncharacterized protein YjbI with pentapeptide repeats
MELRHRDTNEVIYSGEFSSMKELIERANLEGANLRAVDLRGANLEGAKMPLFCTWPFGIKEVIIAIYKK